MRPSSATTGTARGDPLPALSERQRACLALTAEGMTSSRIGEALGLSPRTVDEHLAAACDALGVRTRVQAVAILAGAERRTPEPRSFLP
ncbi:MAG: helix-turn-helix transcriptional regulator [Brevundimonas sp.]|jgi:DNA-binding CsgD family transcriptional regulator|uniref:helix-turn-helix domain-containing protein n=1 Tax=Brevundimonas sp. TaxID=1871086 RepID=UPI00391D2911